MPDVRCQRRNHSPHLLLTSDIFYWRKYADPVARPEIRRANVIEGAVKPWREMLLEGPGDELWLLLGAVGLILLIACANVANLLLTAGSARAGESAVRSALGASRASLMRQMLVESLLLALIGGALGLLVALWGADGMMAMMPESLPAWMKFSIDWRVLAFTLGATTATALLCGVAPGWQASKTDLMSVMKDGELALAMMLLIGAGLMMKSFIRVRQINTGFNADRLMTAGTTLPETQYSEPAQRNNFYRQLLQRLTTQCAR